MSSSENRERNLPVPADEPDSDDSDLKDAWRDVGEQFKQLGSRLADAIRTGWQAGAAEDESEETMRKLRDDLRAAADRVDNVISQARSETAAERQATLKATRKAGAQSLDEARVLTASTLRKLNEQLEKLVQRLEKRDGDETADTAEQKDAGDRD